MTTSSNSANNQCAASGAVLMTGHGHGVILGVPQPQWSLNNQTMSGALSIHNGTENVITFHKNGIIETAAGKIHTDDWIQIIMLMKRFIMDVANDPETAEKYPYIKDMAHTWMMDKLSK